MFRKELEPGCDLAKGPVEQGGQVGQAAVLPPDLTDVLTDRERERGSRGVRQLLDHQSVEVSRASTMN